MLLDRCATRAAAFATLTLPLLWAGEAPAQSETPGGGAGQVVRPIEELPAATGQGAQASPFAELNEALAAARAKLEELNRAAEVASSIGELRRQLEAAREESRQLRAELTTADARRGELQSARDAAQARIAELSAALDEAEAVNARLGGRIDELEAGNTGLRAELSAREQELGEAAEQAAAERAALREELEASQRATAVAQDDRQSAEDRIRALEGAVQRITEESSGLREELAHARDALASAAEERRAAQAAGADLRAEADGLRNRLAAAEERASGLEATNARLSADLQAFRAAASSATDAARQNLEAVESRVQALTAALSDVPEGPEAALDRLIADAGNGEPAGVQAVAAGRPAGQGTASDLEDAKQLDGLDAWTALAADQPLEKRLQLQALLAELKPEADERGLRMTVPGASLFKVDSDDIEETAYETLAKVAELIDAYGGREVLIVGHTDAIGDASYNQMLSERRAALVKEFLVENFEVDDARVNTDGRGEEAPIASNSTNDGRRANRRVEVLLLN